MLKQDNFLKKCLLIFVVFLFVITLGIISGCEKKEAVKGKIPRITEPCNVYDKVPEGIAKPLNVNFGDKVKLIGITINRLSENQLGVTYYWQVLDDLGTYDAVFVHFTDKDNKILLQNDHDFCQRKPFSELKSKYVKEPVLINLSEAIKGKEIYLKIGLYSIEPDIGRLTVKSSDGVPTEENNTSAVVIEKYKI